MARWKFRGQRSFGSIICRGKQKQSAWWFQKHTFFVQEGNKTNPPSNLPCYFYLVCEIVKSYWKTVLVTADVVGSFWTFRDCCGYSSWLGIHKLSDPAKGFKVRLHTRGASIKATLSVGPPARPTVYTHSTKPQLLIAMIQHVIQLIAKSILNNIFLTSLLYVSPTNR
jgi:hypothetical protein